MLVCLLTLIWLSVVGCIGALWLLLRPSNRPQSFLSDTSLLFTILTTGSIFVVAVVLLGSLAVLFYFLRDIIINVKR